MVDLTRAGGHYAQTCALYLISKILNWKYCWYTCELGIFVKRDLEQRLQVSRSKLLQHWGWIHRNETMFQRSSFVEGDRV